MLKILPGRIKGIHGDTKPFTEAESYFAGAKFYMDEDIVPEALPEEIKSTSKATPKKQEWQAVPFLGINDDEPVKPATTTGSKTPSEGSNTPIF
ncbi:hypothetical protein EV2_013675 [Malus domestica]